MHMLCRTRLHAASCSKRVYAVSAATHTHTPRYLRINLHGPSSNLGPIETVHSVDGRTRCIRRGKTQNGLLRMTPTRETRAIRRPAYAATWRCFSERKRLFPGNEGSSQSTSTPPPRVHECITPEKEKEFAWESRTGQILHLPDWERRRRKRPCPSGSDRFSCESAGAGQETTRWAFRH